MEQKDKILLLFTSAFPFGKGEQFIETEIGFLADAFKEVHVFPLEFTGDERPLPANVKVKKLLLYQPYSRPKLFLRKGLLLLGWYRKQLKITRHPEKYKGRFSEHFNMLMHRVADASNAGAVLAQYPPEKTIVYSYWFNVWATVLLFSRAQQLHQLPVLIRAHGGDLDVQQRKTGYFPFRSLEMEMAVRVRSVSAYGEQLLLSAYPEHAGKTGVSRLGVLDNGDNPHAATDVFRIVSCSFVYGLKRLHLIAETLGFLGFRAEWHHFGDGELMEELQKQAAALPENIAVTFHGLVPNRKVLDFYAAQQVDLFMNVSELEGIPVSIMEAISFGIPVTGCRICGVPEIVTEETGFLLEKDFSPAALAAQITAYRDKSFAEKTAFRAGVKTFWKTNFNAAVNYPAFISEDLQFS